MVILSPTVGPLVADDARHHPNPVEDRFELPRAESTARHTRREGFCAREGLAQFVGESYVVHPSTVAERGGR